MDRTSRRQRRLRLLPRLAASLWAAGAPLIGFGCAGDVVTVSLQPTIPAPIPPIAMEKLPVMPKEQVKVHTVDDAKPHEMPITLDTVLRLAEEHNPRIGLAREKLHDSFLQQQKECRSWLPDIYAGVAYYRHEGGIQDFQGNLLHSSTQSLYPGMQIDSELDLREATFRQINSERQVWQQKAELSQIDSEILLEAATTYIDLLSARRGEALARELEVFERKVLTRAEVLAKTERGVEGLVNSVKAVISNRQQVAAKLRLQGNAASAKLVYLLGLPPETVLVPMDPVLAPIELVDVSPPVHDLVAQSMTNGPSVRELEGLLGVIQEGIDKSYGLHNLLPTFKLSAMEGAFGAGPGSQMSFDNRLDMCVQVRWNLTQLAHAEHLREQARSRQTQAMLTYDDVRAKLAASVQEARETVITSREQIGLSQGEIKHASESYRANSKRLEEGLPAGSVGDTLLAVRALEQAHFNYLSGISSHNKAQVRLLLLLGVGSGKEAPPCHP